MNGPGVGPARPRLPVASANQKIVAALPLAAPPIRGLSLGRLEPGVKRERAGSQAHRASAAGQSREEEGGD